MTTFGELRDAFSLDMRHRNLSARTQEIYLVAFDLFDRFAGDRPLDRITQDDVKRWLDEMDVGATTKQIRYRSLRAAWKFVATDQEIPNPMLGLPAPRVRYDPPAYPTDEEVVRLIAAAEDRRNPTRIRDAAIVRLVVDTGMRLGELQGLTVDRIDYVSRIARVTGKTGTHYTAFSQATAIALERWLRARRQTRFAATEALWIGQRGAMTTWGLTQLFERLGRAADLQGLHIHLLRHRRAAKYLSQGGQATHLQAIMGWSSPAMVSRYGASTVNERALDEARRLLDNDA
jgi:integrase